MGFSTIAIIHWLIPILILTIAPTSMAQQVGMQLDSPAQLEWQNRIILVYHQGADERLLGQLEQREAEIIDRRIAWFIVNDERVLSNFPGALAADFADQLRARYPAPVPSALLIGLDGEVKASSSTLELDDLFGRIDQMPIRQWEMQQQ